MKDELPSFEDLIKSVKIVWIVIGELELQSRGYSVPKYFRKSPSKCTTLFSWQQAIFVNKKLGDGEELLIVVTDFAEFVNP